ncbi:MAG: ribokinase [Planctomycetota bacterium]
MQGSKPEVVVVGGTYVDITVKCARMPEAGGNVTGSALSYTITGPGPTEAIQAALCGCHVYLISKIGGDPFGRFVKESLAEYEVNSDFVFTAHAKNTGIVVTAVDGLGENAALTYFGANSALGPQDIDSAEQVISEADICLIHGRLPRDTIIQSIRCAALHSTKVILNPAGPLDPSSLDAIKDDALPIEYFSVDTIIPNLYEAAQLTEHSATNIRTAKLIGSDLVAHGVKTAVITMGKRGCMVVDRSGADHIPAFEIELIDHTGTGDAFAGALAASYAVDDDTALAVKFACAAGALTCTKIGCVEALPSKADIIELLQKAEDIQNR